MRMSKKTVRMMSAIMMFLMMASIASTGLCTDWTPTGNPNGAGTTELKNIINAVLGWAQIIGIGVAVIMLVVLAIKYISAAPGDKAEIKKHAVVYVVGAVVLFGASGLLQIIKSFTEGTIGNGTGA